MLRPCAIDGCEGVTGVPGTAKGLCAAHYGRLRRHGSPLGGNPSRKRTWEPICRLCGVLKDESAFLIRGDSGRRRTECRACQSIQSLKWARANRERKRIAQRKYQAKTANRRSEEYLIRVYGVTLGQAQQIRKGGACAICGQRPTKRLHVDHDHATGCVRGLLCKNCNHGLGMFGDDPARLSLALAYLQAPPGL